MISQKITEVHKFRDSQGVVAPRCATHAAPHLEALEAPAYPSLAEIEVVVHKAIREALEGHIDSMQTLEGAPHVAPQIAQYLSKGRLTTKEAAAILGIGNSKLTTLAKAGTIRSLQVRPNANRQYAREDILAFAASRITGPGSE